MWLIFLSIALSAYGNTSEVYGFQQELHQSGHMEIAKKTLDHNEQNIQYSAVRVLSQSIYKLVKSIKHVKIV